MRISLALSAGIVLVSSGAHAMSVEDLVLDKKTLIGKTVSVTGNAFCANDLCYIGSPGESGASIIFDADRLDRVSRKRLLNCDILQNVCPVTLTGVVIDGIISSLTATSISF